MFDTQDILILNSLDKEVHAVAFGNHFRLKPKQLKIFRGEIGQFLDNTKGYLGLVACPMELAEAEYRDSEEGKAILEKKTQEGIDRHVQWLTTRVNNLRHSLAQDLRSADMVADQNTINSYSTDADLEAMDDLLHYQRQQKDAGKERAEKARIRLRQIESAQNAMANQKKDS